MKRSVLTVSKQLIAILCVAAFTYSTFQELKTFNGHPTSTSGEMKSIPDLQFPAISICDNHFKFGRIANDLRFPLAFPFVRDITQVMIYPNTVYDKLFLLGGNMSTFIWGYYFTIADIIDRCEIGGTSCTTHGESPDANHELQVPAGTWKSTVLADSDKGTNFMCHTLLSNVSLSLQAKNGRSILLEWHRTNFTNLSNFWDLYVHDRNEVVLLHTFSLGNMALHHFMGHKSSDDKLKWKATILPKKHINLKTTHNPCDDDPNYSRNYCEIVNSWQGRFVKMRQYYQDDFRCQIPGIDAGSANLAVCYTNQKDTLEAPLGLLDLVNPSSDIVSQYNYTHNIRSSTFEPPKLTLPPIGSDLDLEACLEPCEYFTYELKNQDVDTRDPVMFEYDVHLFFASTHVELWTRRETMTILSTLANIGGMLGLLLGASVLAILLNLVEICHSMCAQKTQTHCYT